MRKKKLTPKDLELNVKGLSVARAGLTYGKNCEQTDINSYLSTNVCHTMECETALAECFPSYKCRTETCHTNDGCVNTQSGHMDCCAVSEQGDCPHTTDCRSVEIQCESIQICLETSENVCQVSIDCVVATKDCITINSDDCAISGDCVESDDCAITEY